MKLKEDVQKPYSLSSFSMDNAFMMVKDNIR